MVYLPEVIGGGYGQFWNFRGRYRVIKGGRGSKKSTTSSLWFPYNMVKYFHNYGLKPNTLVIRRFFNTHKDSTFAQLQWAINRLGMSHLWKANKNPMELIYKPSGQKIIFRGLDDPQSITSITVADGYLCWVWWEEAFQITNEEDFNKVDLSIRGEMPPELFKQHTLSMNPWSDKIWIKKRFFDRVGTDGLSARKDILAITRNYDCNEFLGEDDLEIFRIMKEENPRRYFIEGEGNWGVSEGAVFTNWQEIEFDYRGMLLLTDNYGRFKYRQMQGLDFGYSNDPLAFIAFMVDEKARNIYIYDEIYRLGMQNQAIFDAIKYKGFQHAVIGADGSAPKDIDALRELGLSRIYGTKGSTEKKKILAGIQKLQDYRIYVHPRCINTIVELSNYTWKKDKDTNRVINEPIGEYNHLMDALRYGADKLSKMNFSF